MAMAATLATLVACDILKVTDATRKKIAAGANSDHVQFYSDHHTPAWERLLGLAIEDIKTCGEDVNKVRLLNKCIVVHVILYCWC
jgi:hypothetical protein